jgi:molybdate transport system substrate-binding protein
VAEFHLLCAGAAKGLVLAIQPAFERDHGMALSATFGAVGAMRDQLEAGTPCDLIVLTRTMIDTLAQEDRIDAQSIRDLGWVHTGVAVPESAPAAEVHTVPQLQALLQPARAIYLPDPQRATAGIHAMRVLRELGAAEPDTRLRTFPNGAAAMAALAREALSDAVGITQVSEILYTPGVRLLGALPEPHQLATLYSGAVVRGADQAAAAADLLQRLAGPAGAPVRARGGFESQP